MRNGKWVLGIAAIALLFCGTAFSQAAPDDYNRLCLHNGGDYYINVAIGGSLFTGTPNSGSGKYYPSYTHITSTPVGGLYYWKIRGYTWVGMKATGGTSIWRWTGMLLGIPSDDYNYTAVPSVSLSCTFPAPHAWSSGALLTAGGGGWSNPLFQWSANGLATSIPAVGGKNFLLPSATSFTSAANIFAIVGGSLNTGTISPFYGYGFGVTYATSATIVASTTAIYQYIFEDQNAVAPGDYHYCIYSGNEMDHNAGYPYAVGDLPGYKGKNQLLIYRPPYQIGWPIGLSTGQNSGNSYSVDMCLLVDDAVLTPVNVSVHAATAAYNPFVAYGFDVGTATMTPEVASGGAFLGFTTEDYKASGQAFAILASKHTPGSEAIGALQYDGNSHRYPCGSVDGVTNYFLARLTKWLHAIAFPFPTCAWNLDTVGGFSAQLPIGAKFQASLPGKEYIFCGFLTNATSGDCTSGWMVTWR